MLSVNIPVFNIKVGALAEQLLKQGEQLGVPFEVRIYDDGSALETKVVNRTIASMPGIVYVEMDHNMGRAAIRNKMGKESVYNLLLFIDADSRLINENYLASYIEKAKAGTILCGGTAYNAQKPQEKDRLLRWQYGRKREAISAEKRNGKKGFIITSNNFLIEKQVFEKYLFREHLRSYGHEDTMLGFDLFKAGVDVVHIDNPVEHTGLEQASVFVAKTREALKNLDLITRQLAPGDKDFTEQVKFLRNFQKLQRLIPNGLLKQFYYLFGPLIEKNLLSNAPSMLLFDLYKVAYYSTLKY